MITLHKTDTHILLKQSSIDKQVDQSLLILKNFSHATLTVSIHPKAFRKIFLHIKKTCLLGTYVLQFFLDLLSFDFSHVLGYNNLYLVKFSNISPYICSGFFALFRKPSLLTQIMF